MKLQKLMILPVMALVAAFIALSGGEAVAVICGDTLIVNTTLTSDLACVGTGLEIGAAGVTLDLAGFKLESSTGAGLGVDNLLGFGDVTVKNGTIDGFEQGIRSEGGNGFTIEAMTFTGDTGGSHGHVIDIRDDDGSVTIKGVTIVVGPSSPWWGEAIRLESVDSVLVEKVHVVGGFVGVNFACGACDGSDDPTNGTITKSGTRVRS